MTERKSIALPPDGRHQGLPYSRASSDDLRWSELQSRMRRFVASRVGSQWTDDVTSDILLKLLQNQDQFSRARNPLAWVYRVAANAIADHYRGRGVESRALEQVGVAVTAAPSEADEEDPESARRAIAACLKPFVLDLPPNYAEALVLTSFEGLSQREAARRLGLSHSGMKSRVQRARAELKRRLLDCCEFQRDRRGKVVTMRPHA